MGVETKKLSVLDKIARIFYAGFLIVFIFVISLTLIVPHGMIRVFGVGYYRVNSPSMDPTLQVNDYVIAVRVDVNNLEEGDIILFNTKRQIGDLEMVEKIFVIHYFGYMNEEGHIFTYPEANKELAASDPLKYDSWGTKTNPYYVSRGDIVGVHSQTIRGSSVLSSIYQVFYSPYFYLGVGVLTVGGFASYYYLNTRQKKKKD